MHVHSARPLIHLLVGECVFRAVRCLCDRVKLLPLDAPGGSCCCGVELRVIEVAREVRAVS